MNGTQATHANTDKPEGVAGPTSTPCYSPALLAAVPAPLDAPEACVEPEQAPGSIWFTPEYPPGVVPPPPLSIDPEEDWHVFTAVRKAKGAFSRWSMMTRQTARHWGQMRPGTYASMQAYPEPHKAGTSKGRVHASLFWLDFDAPTLLDSCHAAYRTLEHVDRYIRPPDVDEYDAYTIRYSGNRSIHLGINLGLSPSAELTLQYKTLAAGWLHSGAAPHCDLGLYTEPRLLPVPGSIRFDTGRKIIVLSVVELVDGCGDAGLIVSRATDEGCRVLTSTDEANRERTSA